MFEHIYKLFEWVFTSVDFSIYFISCVACFHFGQGFRKQLYRFCVWHQTRYPEARRFNRCLLCLRPSLLSSALSLVFHVVLHPPHIGNEFSPFYHCTMFADVCQCPCPAPCRLSLPTITGTQSYEPHAPCQYPLYYDALYYHESCFRDQPSVCAWLMNELEKSLCQKLCLMFIETCLCQVWGGLWKNIFTITCIGTVSLSLADIESAAFDFCHLSVRLGRASASASK